MDRYLFVAADFNEKAIPKPVLEKLPEEKPAAKAAEAKADAKEAKPVDGVKKEEPKKEEPKKDEVKADAPAKAEEVKKDDAKKDEPKKGEVKTDPPAKAEDSKKDEVKKDEVKTDPPAKAEDVKKDEPQKDEVKKDGDKKDETAKEAKGADALAAQRKQIETENKRRQDDYDNKVAAGQKHAKELSDRFAQWYYVIPGQTYAKIHLDRSQIVKKKEPPKDADGHDHDHDAPDACPPVRPGRWSSCRRTGPRPRRSSSLLPLQSPGNAAGDAAGDKAARPCCRGS